MLLSIGYRPQAIFFLRDVFLRDVYLKGCLFAGLSARKGMFPHQQFQKVLLRTNPHIQSNTPVVDGEQSDYLFDRLNVFSQKLLLQTVQQSHH